MTKTDIDNIMSVICPNDEDYEKPIISPAYLKKELETLAIEQEPSGDLISRQVVISTIYDNESDFKNDFAQGFFADRIRDLPPVNLQESKTDVLDKIRAEIKALSNANPSYWHSGDMVEREEVFEIIDKYKAESEE